MKKNTFLVLLFHGSKREAAFSEAASMVAEVSQWFPETRVFPAFLQFISPSLPDTLQKCLSMGASCVKVFPLFVLSGSHVESDIPAMLDSWRKEHSGVEVELLPHLGVDPSFRLWLRSKIQGQL